MDASQFERELRRLRDRAEAELDHLADERVRLERLIALIDERTASPRMKRKRRQRTNPRQTPLLELIRQRPGIRTSMLAMVTKRSSEDVAAELADAEARGTVARRGLGWCVTG